MDPTRFERIARIAATYHVAGRSWILTGRAREGHVYRDFCEAEADYNTMMDAEFPMALPPEQSARWSELARAFGPTVAEYHACEAIEEARRQEATP